jgi:hypothetical protein
MPLKPDPKKPQPAPVAPIVPIIKTQAEREEEAEKKRLHERANDPNGGLAYWAGEEIAEIEGDW